MNGVAHGCNYHCHNYRYAYPQKLHGMLTSIPDYNGRANFDECLEVELFVCYSMFMIYIAIASIGSITLFYLTIIESVSIFGTTCFKNKALSTLATPSRKCFKAQIP